jgi:sugar phosphate isomerase/epimerase
VIRQPLALRIDEQPDRSPREAIEAAARLGARGVVIDAGGPLAPHRLSETGRRDLRHLLRTTELALVALHLPARRPFDTEADLDDRLARAERAFALAYELGSPLVLLRAGTVPPESDGERRAAYQRSLNDLGLRADRQGVRLAVEAGGEPAATLRAVLDAIALPTLAASVDPSAFQANGQDPAQSVAALGEWVAHAYAPNNSGAARRPGVAIPSGRATSAGGVDWEAYLGALEEIDYRGYLTVWPDPASDPDAQFREVAELVRRF